MESEEIELICSNCSYFFPASMEGSFEYGICLHDKVFERYIDELIKRYNYDSCRELIEEKKFLGDTEACQHFEEPEESELDDTMKFNNDAIESAVLVDQLENIDWKTIPVGNYAAKLNDADKNKQLESVSTLGSLAALGNKNALSELIEYFRALNPPITLEEVHFKQQVFWHIENLAKKSVIIPCLIYELYHIQSNNTTREWISKILQYLEHCPIGMIRKPLENLLNEKNFSYKMKTKIENTIIISEENTDWAL
ncbi:hypothetical protein JXA02_11485 [candidate division KSB1 bacterium]|nr:hypothetical protein [candidate division KSB1 bacterium]RQW02408.1 MAG: hypothetical protein EH222_13720 [candidate division KSB1 bacterium]